MSKQIPRVPRNDITKYIKEFEVRNNGLIRETIAKMENENPYLLELLDTATKTSTDEQHTFYMMGMCAVYELLSNQYK